jgi:hypothetical protein
MTVFQSSQLTQEEASLKVHRSRSVRRAEVTTDGRNLVSHAGTAMLSELADRTGLTHGLSAAMADCTKLGADQAHRGLGVELGAGMSQLWCGEEARNPEGRGSRAEQICETNQLGIEETTCLAATPDHSTIFATSFVDTKKAKLVDVIKGQDTKILRPVQAVSVATVGLPSLPMAIWCPCPHHPE